MEYPDHPVISKMAEVQVQMNFRYLDNGEEGSTLFSIPSDTQTLWDLKLLIQENINSPACDLKVFFQGQQLQDPSLLLKNLYFRERDLVKVDAPAKIDIPSLRKVIGKLKEFKERIEKGENSFEDCKNEDELQLVYSTVEHSLSTITDQFFAPWNTKKAATSRHFFVQDGGFSALMVLLRYSQQQPCGLSGIQKTRRFLMSRSKIRKTFSNHLQLQLNLQAECLSLLWRFMVRAADRKYVVENGGIEVILFGLMLSPEAHLSAGSISDERLGVMLSWKTIMVNQQALGCLAGCVEYDKYAQEIVANDKAAVDKLLDMMCKNSRDNLFYRLFFSLVAANTLFYVTFSSQALKKLTDDHVYLKIIPLAEKFLNASNSDVRVRGDTETNPHDDSLHLGYYLCLILARMLASPLVNLDANTASTINSLINSCMAKVTPAAIARLEEQQSYVWVTLVPLVHLAFAGGLETSAKEGVFTEEVTMATETSLSQTALDREHPLLVQNCCTIPTFPGSQVVQRLGIFAMQHLLYSTANRQLLLYEDLLQYLVCLSWQLQFEEKHKLRSELNKFDDVKPPSLKAAAKSVLARLHGFEMILKSY